MKKLTFFALLSAVAILSFSFTDKKPKSASILNKSLAFPVAGKKSNIGDLWGASRDGGRRKHKGIDIYARKGTPIVAISDGIIETRGTFPVGGKVLWLKPDGEDWTAYYAHLDRWMVKEGQSVKKGQVIGTVGNTGNARSTPSHLHFGISTNKGWVNPYPYVKTATKVAAPKIAAKKHTKSPNKLKNKKRNKKR